MNHWLNNQLKEHTALAFVILLGFVSLFADVTYEGARSISGQYLSLLDASAIVIAAVSGFSEFIGYAGRLLFGYISDKTKQYWLILFVGYTMNLIAVPLLAFASTWQIAAFLIILERFGKSIRTPTRDAMLSYATKEMGRGWGFGLHAALDQAGSFIGPLVIAAVLYYQGSYSLSFALLAFPAAIALTILIAAQQLYPRPQELEIEQVHLEDRKFSKEYWTYLMGTSFVAAGFADFPFIAFHWQHQQVVQEIWIPLFYALGMSVAGLAALCLGKMYDKRGMPILMGAIIPSALFSPLVFFGGFYLSLLGVALWGVGMGVQASIMRAAVANLVPWDKRSIAYGIFNTSFGVAWLVGSLIIGMLYTLSLMALVLFSVAIQFAALPCLLIVWRGSLKRT